MTARLILVRHGQTAHNAAGRFQGHGDMPLDAVGADQARALGAYLARAGVHAPIIHTSDLPRAMQTAQSLAEATGGSVSAFSALREIHVGDWAGQTFENLRKQHPEAYAGWLGGHPDFRFPGGEGFAEVGERLASHLDLHPPQNGRTLILVTHGVAISALLCRLLDLEFAGSWTSRTTLHGNTAFSELELEGGKVVRHRLAQSPHIG